MLLPRQWKILKNRNKKLAIHYMRFLWYIENPIIRPLFIADILMLLLPKQPIAIPTAIGLGFGYEAFIRSFESIFRGGGGKKMTTLKQSISSKKPALIAIAVILLLAVSFSMINHAAQPKELPLSTLAWYTCEHYISQSLKAPSTADFEHPNPEKINQITPGTFEMIIFVDAQNSFGAMIRTHFYCQIHYDSANDQWTLYHLNEQ